MDRIISYALCIGTLGLLEGITWLLRRAKLWNELFLLATLAWVMSYNPRWRIAWWVGLALSWGGAWLIMDGTGRVLRWRTTLSLALGAVIYLFVCPWVFRLVYWFCGGLV